MAGSTPASLSAEAPVRAPATAAEPRKARSISPALETWRRFRRHVLAVTGAIVLLILVSGVLLGPYVWPVAINDIDFAAKLQGPSLAHPLGTDDLGQDLLARMMYGGRISLAVGFAAMLVALFVGVLVGSVAGMASGWVDAALMWLTDLFLALPTLPLLLLVMYLFRDSVKKVLGVEGGAFVLIVVVIGGLRWMPVARLVRAQFLSLREKEFVEAARALGASKVRQVVQHILPNALGPVIVVGTIDVAAAIIFESTLSFLGPRLPVRRPDLGLDAARRQGLSRHRRPLGPVPGRRDLPHRARDQLHRRRAARRLRSAPRALGASVSVADTLLDIRGLKTWFKTEDGMVRAVDGVDLHIDRGETVGVVGESGCGKTVTARSVLKLIDMPPGRFEAGQILWQGRDLIPLDQDEMNKIRAREIAIIFQEPMTSLNPVYTVGDQIAEVIALHQKLSPKQAMAGAAEMLRLVNIPNPQRRVHDYPHQFSGGMRQRVMIAMALSCQPKLLIADEPTTALDVTIQAQILELMHEMKDKFGMAIMLITHAMGVVAETCQRVTVMYAGKVVEEAPVEALFGDPRHPYTQGLIRSIPRIDRAVSRQARLESIQGTVPSLLNPPPGCRFAARCKYAMDICTQGIPPLKEVAPGHRVACVL